MWTRWRWPKLRRWIGAATAFGFALHVLISGLALPRLSPIFDSTDVFAICHGAGTGGAGEPAAPGKKLPTQGPCILCALSGACAVLPGGSGVVIFDTIAVSEAFPLGDFEVLARTTHNSNHPRAPPIRTLIAG
jgi:hypothetical protein